MPWSEPISLYCERTSPAFWAEPVNAATNVAFLIAAALALALWRSQERKDPATAALIALTAVIGLGSFAFHTLATKGAALLDVIPIALFVYGYLLLALRRFLQLSLVATCVILVGFIIASRALASVVSSDVLNGSLEYLPPLAALITVGLLLRRNGTGRSILLAAALFTLSLVFRTIDRDVCAGFPLGTHFVWHLLNAAVLFFLLRTAITGRS
jgi:Ceramidase